MTRNSLRAAIVAAATVPVIAFGPAIAAAGPASPIPAPVQPAYLNPQQGPLGAALTCSPLAFIPFAGPIAIACWV
ncbi:MULTISPECIES: hypothetical protein [Rhodococcus]|uniref:hypothetical protein n=1 Tax=Rhodococcus TaxID=1827 RepID=UPI000BCC85D1|nr:MULTISPECIES: hypothetical protein [Rhodococcus]MBP1160143.1 hypothetical protein [Rhodococcus sp. PvR099]MCZ4557161.1 hypothetical protein [Rhodococcus maanshanensis]PTR42726.1 hypothetical protein C8K38_11023 [Rhodococcus sp. OK611]SNX91917.1 hypothetical protein SAMN05447004_111204 [Rhodococcus sp. OK270]